MIESASVEIPSRTRGYEAFLVRLSDWVDGITAFLAVAFTAGFAAVMLLGVFFRYVLNASLSWSDEVAVIAFGWATMLFVASAYLHDRHVRVDIFVQWMPERWRGPTTILAEGLAGGYLLALIVSSLQAMKLIGRSHTDALHLPMTIHFLAVPVAAVIMMVHWARLATRDGSGIDRFIKAAIAVALFLLVYLQIGRHVDLSGSPKAAIVGIALIAPMLIGVPVAISLGLAGTLYLAVLGDMSFMTGGLQIFYGINTYALTAIPLLILSGKLLHAAGIATHLVDFAQILVGRVRGGLGASNVVASFLFGDISGSAVSDTAAVGSLMIPEMKRRGYRADFCAALQGAAGTLGMMAPLSITVLLYSAAANSSVSRLAAATIVPAFFLALSFVVYVLWHGRRHDYPKEAVSIRLVLPRTLRAIPALCALALIVAGILGGVFTPTETGSILLAYVLILAVAFYGLRDPGELYSSFLEAGHITGMTLFMVCTSGLVGFVLARDLVSVDLLEMISNISMDRYFVIFVVSAIFIVLGMFLEPPAMIFGFLPTFLPLLTKAGVDVVHWGVLLAVNTGLGCIVPPVALNLFVSTKIAEVTYGQAIRAAVPFILIMLVDLAVIGAFPKISLFLPHLLFDYPLQ